MDCLEEIDPEGMGCAKLVVNKYVDKCSSGEGPYELPNVLCILDLL